MRKLSHVVCMHQRRCKYVDKVTANATAFKYSEQFVNAQAIKVRGKIPSCLTPAETKNHALIWPSHETRQYRPCYQDIMKTFGMRLSMSLMKRPECQLLDVFTAKFSLSIFILRSLMLFTSFVSSMCQFQCLLFKDPSISSICL